MIINENKTYLLLVSHGLHVLAVGNILLLQKRITFICFKSLLSAWRQTRLPFLHAEMIGIIKN